jgi:hypothetical protein
VFVVDKAANVERVPGTLNIMRYGVCSIERQQTYLLHRLRLPG